MTYKVLNDKLNLTDSEKDLARNLGISDKFLNLLLNRGIEENEVYDYLHPTLDKMSNPLDILGMREARDRLNEAIRKKEKLLIFGDYDCDGICAISILTLFLRDKLDVRYFIPDRNKHGYGMTIDVLEQIIKVNKPDLIITVDCGITSVQETDFLKSQGIDVIITDHHEPQEIIPNTIVVDPKIEKKGFYDFCGAGVALKLVEALAGRKKACEYLDICAIATIADVVPLQKENRIIAKFGLQSIAKTPRKGIKMMVGANHISSQDVMFKMAPRLNAAGRLNSAMKVVDLFLNDDYFLLRSLVDELERDNSKRQEICEAVVTDAKNQLIGVDFNKIGIIILESKNWEAGVLGIAAARLTEEFDRPTILFSRNGDELKGSCRSIPSVNIFEELTNVNEYFINFGGHSQAAGVTMKLDKFNEFREKINKNILDKHKLSEFVPTSNLDMELDIHDDMLRFSRELELMEPTGYGNGKPSFVIRGRDFRFETLSFTPHIKCSKNNFDILAFQRFQDQIPATRGDFEIEATLGLNEFQNNITAQAIVKSIEVKSLDIDEEDSIVYSIHQLKHEGTFKGESITKEHIEELLKKPFGTLFVVFNKDEYNNLIDEVPSVKDLPIAVGNTRSLNTQNTVICVPSEHFTYDYYENVIICGSPLSLGYLNYIKEHNKNTYVFGNIIVKPIDLNINTLRNVFRVVRDLALKHERQQSFKRFYIQVKSRYNVSYQEFKLIVEIFEELDLINISDRGIIKVSNKKTDLEKSVTYRNIEIGRATIS